MNTIPNDLNPLGKEAEPAAPEQPDLPEGYTRLAFIQNNGANSVYYPGVKSDKNTVYSGRFLQKTTVGAPHSYVFSTYNAGWGVTPNYGSNNTVKMFFCSRNTADDIPISRTTPNEFYADIHGRVMNGVFYPHDEAYFNEKYTSNNMTIFGFAWNVQIVDITQIWWFKYLPYLDLLPCVTPDGRVAFFNKIDQTAKSATHGKGELVGGIETIDQLTALAANLPAATGTPEINLSLPGEFENDSEVQSYLIKIMAKGWTPNITYRA